MASMPLNRKSFVTTLNTDNYLPGVLVLDKTIREKCSHGLFVLVSRDLAEATYEALRCRGIAFDFADDVPIDPVLLSGIDSSHSHWANTFFKFRIFELTQFDKIVYIDSDAMVIEPIDDLFDRPNLSAVIADKSYPGNEDWSSLNSGVLVIEPREGTVKKLMDYVPVVASKQKNFGDQDVLAAYYSHWEQDESLHLPEEYNVFFHHYQFYRKRGSVKIVHFSGKKKPWMNTSAIFLSCILKGNMRGIAIMLRFLRYLKEAEANG